MPFVVAMLSTCWWCLQSDGVPGSPPQAAAGAANQDTQPHPVTVTKPAPVHDTDVAAAPLALAAGPAASVAGALLPVAPVAENVHATRRVEFVEGELAPVVKVGAIHFRVIPLQAIRIPGSFSERYRS